MSLRDLAEYAPARAAEAVLGTLPKILADRMGLAAGSGAWRLGTRRDVVEDQIAAAFPDQTPEWIAKVTRACYRHFGREIAAIARIGRHGGEHLLELMEAGDEAVALHREATGGSGVEPIYMQDARTRIPEALREGKTVALVADQNAGERGVFVPFLGREASTFRGPARLALSQGVPLFFGAAVRKGAGYDWVLDEVPRPSPGEDAERELTRRWVERLEAQIRLHPEQYFWFHRRWKTRPAGTTAGPGGT